MAKKKKNQKKKTKKHDDNTTTYYTNINFDYRTTKEIATEHKEYIKTCKRRKRNLEQQKKSLTKLWELRTAMIDEFIELNIQQINESTIIITKLQKKKKPK